MATVKPEAVKAVAMAAPGTIDVRSYPYPQLSRDSAILKVETAGVCGTGKHIFRGEANDTRGKSIFPCIGGNRIIFNLDYNHSGFDLVHLADGRMRLAANEWPDGLRNDSSPGRLAIGKRTFFAVTYDASLAQDNVHWYFGDDQAPAELDCATTCLAGATAAGSGPVAVGNYNETLHSAGLDRQFRGKLLGIHVFGSRLAGRGALSLDELRGIQQETVSGR